MISAPIPIANTKVALIIRIPKSWIAPHRVTLGGHDKFYSRNSSGKYPLDVGELRIAFNLSETVTERIRNFRLDRISKIIANETPVPLYNTAKIALHLIPIMSLNPAQFYAINAITSNPEKMPPINCISWDDRYNLDGFLTYFKDREGKSWSYVQLFRSGIIEAVDISMLDTTGHGRTIPSRLYEKELVKSFSIYLSILKLLSVEPPMFVFLDLFGVKGYSMAVEGRRQVGETRVIDRDVLLLPEAIIESYDVLAEKVLKPLFYSIWNACGFPRSFNYNENGEWAPR
jgi:hypothetical protein